MFKFVSNLLLGAGKYISLPLLVGGAIFYWTHDWIDTHLQIRCPRLRALPTSGFVEGLGNWLVFDTDPMTENKIIYLYFIIIWSMVLSIVGWNCPTAGVVLLGILLMKLEYIGILYHNLNDWQTTIFNWGGITIERTPSLNELRLLYERWIDETNLIAPGFNPCKMARDALHGHADGKGLLQDMIEEVWLKEETYSSYAGKASHFFHMPFEWGTTSYDTPRTGWYDDYSAFPEWEPIDETIQRDKYCPVAEEQFKWDVAGFAIWSTIGVIAGEIIWENYIAQSSAAVAPMTIQLVCSLMSMWITG